MIIKMLFIIVVILYTTFNIMVSACCDAKEMREDLIDGQCAVGRIFANIFYAPAWLLKGIRFIVIRTIK